MIWNREPKVTHVELHVLSVGVYDAIAHFNNGEKAALDIMELLSAHPFIGCRNHRKNVRRCCFIPKKKAITQKHWNWKNLIWKGELLKPSTESYKGFSVKPFLEFFRLRKKYSLQKLKKFSWKNLYRNYELLSFVLRL